MGTITFKIQPGFIVRSARIAQVQLRAFWVPLLVVAGLEVFWGIMAPWIPLSGDPLASARLRGLGFELAIPASLMLIFFGTIQTRDQGTLTWFRLLSSNPFEIVIGLLLWGSISASVLLLAGCPALVVGLAGVSPGIGWALPALTTVIALISTLFFLLPMMAFQLWAAIRREPSPGRDTLWLTIQVLAGVLLAFGAGHLVSSPSRPETLFIALGAGLLMVVSLPAATVLLLLRASSNLADIEAS